MNNEIKTVKTFEEIGPKEFQCIISIIGFGKTKKEAEENAILNSNFNYIGKLQEVCTKRKWLMPIYTEQPTTGTEHDKIFNYSCSITINNSLHTMFGCGLTKTSARKDAAFKLLNMVVARTEEV